MLPKMVENKKGTIILSGATASLRGGAKFTGLVINPKAFTNAYLLMNLECWQVRLKIFGSIPSKGVRSSRNSCSARDH